MRTIYITLLALIASVNLTRAQEDYVNFDDTSKTVNGVYMGFAPTYGVIDGESAYMFDFKVSYVANKSIELGLEGVGFFMDNGVQGEFNNLDVTGGYGGLHVEPILFGDSNVNLSFPILIGGGAIGYIEGDYDDSWQAFGIVEPGVSVNFGISNYVQLEVFGKYRWSSEMSAPLSPVDNMNGYSVGVGVKVGVFNMK